MHPFARPGATMLLPSGVSSARLERSAASISSASVWPPTGSELEGQPVAEGDRARLVQQQGVHVARRLHRAPAHGQHVELHQAVHSGDADGREQAADGGGNQADLAAPPGW